MGSIQPCEELLERKIAAPFQKTEITATGICRADHATPLYPSKVGTNVDEWRSLNLFVLFVMLQLNSTSFAYLFAF
jgi:hypothetical protein